jgi:hypothetical protein
MTTGRDAAGEHRSHLSPNMNILVITQYPKRPPWVSESLDWWHERDPGLRILTPDQSMAKDFFLPISPEDPGGSVAAAVREHASELIFFKTDWFDPVFKNLGKAILERSYGVPLVFGYHCHVCGAHENELERLAFTHANGLVLLNKRWYNETEFLPLISEQDETPHIVIPSYVFRFQSDLDRFNAGQLSASQIPGNRYDYFRIAHELTERGIHVHLFGQPDRRPENSHPGTLGVYRSTEERCPFFHLEGLFNGPGVEFNQKLSQYDACVPVGFLPGRTERFEHMNYQLRMNPTLAAGLPMLVAKGTGYWLENEIGMSGAGLVYESFDEVLSFLQDRAALGRASQAAIRLQERHSFDYWIDPLMRFFGDVVDRFRVRT